MAIRVVEKELNSSLLLERVERKDFKQVFAAIVSDTEDFFSSAFEESPVHFKASTPSNGDCVRRLSAVFSREKLLEICKSNELVVDTNMQALRYDGRTREMKAFRRNTISPSELESAFKAGYSCQFFQPQRFGDELHVLNAGFEYVFGTLAGASAYLTPARAQGLAPHHDDVEVFILQTEGSKLWRLWAGPLSLPETYSADIPRQELPDNHAEVLLQCGDVLYLPRGTIHEAVSQEGFSTHVTISVYQHYNYRRLLSQVLEKTLDACFQTNLELRKGLPTRLSHALGSFIGAIDANDNRRKQREDILSTIQNLAAKVVSTIDLDLVDSAVDEMVGDFSANRLPPPVSSLEEAPIIGGKKRKRLAELTIESKVALFDPNCSHYEIRDMEGVKTLVMVHNKSNNRLRHMCHPTDDDESENENLPVTHFMPRHFLPIIKELFESFSEEGTIVASLLKNVSKHRFNEEDVLRLLKDMNRHGFLVVLG